MQGEHSHERPLRSLEGQDETNILREIHSALKGLRFGAVEITVHNGQVVQIERKEKNSACRPRTPTRPPDSPA
ncbi:sulfur starvation response protein OscA [Azotobacter vinelandii]